MTTPWGASALAGVLGDLATVEHGDRNNRLNKAAFRLGQLIAGDQLDEAEALGELRRIAAALGLGDREAAATIASGIGDGKQHPAQPEERRGDPFAGTLGPSHTVAAPAPPKVATRPVVDDTTPAAPDVAEAVLERFLGERRWSPATAELVGLTVVLDRWGRPRVRFPFTIGGEALVWQDRATQPGQQPKYLTPAGATLIPFGLDTMAAFDLDDAYACPVDPITGRSPLVYLVEGPADAVTLLEHWPDVAVLGVPGSKGWKPALTAALTRVGVVVITDNDTAGAELRQEADRRLTEPGLAHVVHVAPPAEHNDLSDWHCADPARFAEEFPGVVLAALLPTLAGVEGVAA